MPIKIEQEIVGYSVVSPSEVEPELPDTGEKLPRPSYLEGATYKITPLNYGSMYLTVNDSVDEEGRHRPFEIFINMKGSEDYAWIKTLSLVISAIFRRRGNYEMVMDELEDVVDPKGGYWIPRGDGHRVESVVAHIGYVLRQHCIRTGAINE